MGSATCDYVARKDDPSTWGGEDPGEWFLDRSPGGGGLGVDVWECPHPPLETDRDDGDEYCVFHTGAEAVPEDIDEGEALLLAIEGADNRPADDDGLEHRAQFVGATFGALDLSGATVVADEGRAIRFDHAVFGGQGADVSLEDTTFVARSDGLISFVDAEFVAGATGVVNASGVSVTAEDDGDVRFDGAAFTAADDGFLNVRDATFAAEGDVRFDGATFTATGDGDVGFLNATFTAEGDVRFDGATFSAEGDGVVTFAGSRVTAEGGDVRFMGSRITARDAGAVRFAYTTFTAEGDGTVDFVDATFTAADDGSVGCTGATFSTEGDGYVGFEGASFTARGEGDVRFDGATFSANGSPTVGFSGMAYLPQGGYAVWFLETTFVAENDGTVAFRDARFTAEGLGVVAFAGGTFYTVGDGTVRFDGSRFSADDDGHITFDSVRFRSEDTGDLRFTDIELSGTCEFTSTTFDSAVSFAAADFSTTELVDFEPIPGMDFERANFTDTDLSATTFRGSNVEQAVFSRADLFGTDFTGARIDGALFGDAMVNNRTDFGQLPDTRRGTVRADAAVGASIDTFRVAYDRDPAPATHRGWLTRCITRYLPTAPRWDRVPWATRLAGTADASSPDDVDVADGETNATDESTLDQIQRAASAYQTIEGIARGNALSRLQSQAFVRRKEMNRLASAERASRQVDPQTGGNANWMARLWWRTRWLQASAARMTLLYGESPWRVICTALLIIVAGGLVYPFGGFRRSPAPGEPASEPINAPDAGPIWTADGLVEYLSILPDSLHFSTLTFVTTGFGDFQPHGWGRVLATIETAAGALLLALLVFVLSRRAAR